MSFMKRLRRIESFSKAIVIACLIVVVLPSYAQVGRWDSRGAALAFQNAQKLKAELSQQEHQDIDRYLECARTFRKVHVLDPHFSRAGDAIYEEALLFQEMGERFGKAEYFQTAVKRFQLLIRDYGGNRNCPDALLRIGDIYFKSLGDQAAATEAYELLQRNYRVSSAVRELRSRTSFPSSLPNSPKPRTSDDSFTNSTASPASALVQSIRHWSAPDHTLVAIELNASSRYIKKSLSNPERIYFDIHNAKLANSMALRTMPVGDGMLKQIRLSQNQSEYVRIVLDLTAKCHHSVQELQNPFRIMVELRHPNETAPSRLSPAISPGSQAPTPLPDQVKSANTEKQLHASQKQPIVNEVAAPAPKLKEPPRAITAISSLDLKPPKLVFSGAPGGTPAKETPRAENNNIPSGVSKSVEVSGMPKISGGEAKGPVESVVPNKGDAVKTAQPGPEIAVSGESLSNAIKGSNSKQPIAALPKPADPTSTGNRTLTRTLGLKIGRIVIDPGHGGNDLGTVGPNGLLEKDLVLSIALELQKLLQDKLGAHVLLTRTEDVFVPLEERTNIANRFRADLFISIHANSSRNRSVSGVETYFLSFAKTPADREVASRENATSSATVSDLEDLVKQIALADKSAESRELASIIQKNLYAELRKVLPSAKDRGVRSAPFVVLIGANMPCILTEVAFVSNPRDERILRKSMGQEQIARALLAGIQDYMKTLGSDVAQNRQRVD